MVNKDLYKIKKITDTIWSISENSFAILYLVIGAKKALLIDTGFGIGNLPELCSSITSLPVEVILTHAHPDHVMGAGQFDVVHIAKEDGPLLKTFFGRDARIAIASEFLSGQTGKQIALDSLSDWIKQELKSVQPIANGDVIDLGGRYLRVIATPGHTTGSICLLDESERILFSGDTILKSYHLLNLEESASLKTFFESLLHVKSFEEEYDTLFPGHEPAPLPLSHLKELINGVQDILDGKIRGTRRQTRVGSGIKYRFGNGNSVICRID